MKLSRRDCFGRSLLEISANIIVVMLVLLLITWLIEPRGYVVLYAIGTLMTVLTVAACIFLIIGLILFILKI